MEANTKENPNLAERLKTIEQLPLDLNERIHMALVCLGEIQAWETCVIYEDKTKSKVDELNTMLIDAGFETRLGPETRDPHSTYRDREIMYANSIENAEKLLKVRGRTEEMEERERDMEMGRLYGFPETSINAYVDDHTNMIGQDNLPEDIKSQDCMALFAFMFSKEHLEEEIAVLKRWEKVLKQKVPDLWKNFIEKWKEEKSKKPTINTSEIEFLDAA